MIYYINEEEVGPVSFRSHLKEDLGKLFGIKDQSIIFQLSMEVMENLSHTFEEVSIGDNKYQVLVHPIKIVYKSVGYHIDSTKYINPCVGCDKYNKPYWSVTNPCQGCQHYKGVITTNCNTFDTKMVDASLTVSNVASSGSYIGSTTTTNGKEGTVVVPSMFVIDPSSYVTAGYLAPADAAINYDTRDPFDIMVKRNEGM